MKIKIRFKSTEVNGKIKKIARKKEKEAKGKGGVSGNFYSWFGSKIYINKNEGRWLITRSNKNEKYPEGTTVVSYEGPMEVFKQGIPEAFSLEELPWDKAELLEMTIHQIQDEAIPMIIKDGIAMLRLEEEK